MDKIKHRDALTCIPSHASVYLHIPFCEQCCDYCDFYSIVVPPTDERLDSYVDTLLADAKEQIHTFALTHLVSLYIGGGTPSLLGPQRLSRLVTGITALSAAPLVEITVEVNPQSLSRTFLEVCEASGVSRISIGVQTFDQRSRQAVHRAGSSAQVKQGLELCAELFPSAFSVDLMSGLPFQTEDALASDIETVLLYKPAHIALYALTVEPGSCLEPLLPDQDSADALFIQGCALLETAGYEQYEVSNFALPGKRSVHNIRYWRMEQWIGCGAGASGTIIDEGAGTGFRLTYRADADAYLHNRHSCYTREALNRKTLIKETVLMGFRYAHGPDLRLFKRRFGIELAACIPRTLVRWQDKMVRASSYDCLPSHVYALSHEGLLFLNAFLHDAFDEIDLTVPDS
ncbi:MAG: radical SAM family heme chaperone HemW [Spirochaetaceae bacterium]|nr:radical SAM family heme chaperone HemW [Spirochaetaceae bacterium]